MNPIEIGIRALFGVLAALLFLFGASSWCQEPLRLRVVSGGLFCLTVAFFLVVKWT